MPLQDFWINLIELQINSIGLQRFSPKKGILSYAKSTRLEKYIPLVHVIGRFGHEQFLFSFSFIFWLYRDFVFFFFFFSFGWWRGTWHCSHMTYHMMWCHRPRRWWKDLEDDIRAHGYNMVTLRRTWGRGIDIRAELSISSTDYEDFVYIGP